MDKKQELLKLRNGTSASYEQCIKALEATNYNYNEAVKWLKDHKIIDKAKKDGYTLEKCKIEITQQDEHDVTMRETKIETNTLRRTITLNNSNVFFYAYLSNENKIGVVLGLNKAIDYSLVKPILVNIAANDPQFINVESIPEQKKEELKAEIVRQLKQQNKPENMIDKIALGMLQKQFSEMCLTNQALILDKSKKVKDLLTSLDVQIVQFVRYEAGEGF